MIAFYDFLIFVIFSVQIGAAFFPIANPFARLLATLLTFAAGFAMRPIGAITLGRIADRAGRTVAMRISFLLLAGTMFGFAVLPGHDRLGLWACWIAVMLRLVQGFAIGGEFGPSTAYLLESAPVGRSGLYASFQFAGQNAAILLAGLVASALASLMNEAELADWGWRIAFAAGGLLLIFAYPLRRSLRDPERNEIEGALPPQRVGPGLVSCAVVLFAQSTVALYTLLNMATYALTTLGMSAQQSYLAPLLVGAISLAFCPLGGLLSDLFGRKRVMTGASMLLLVIAAPGLAAVLHTGRFDVFVAWCICAAACASITCVASCVCVAERLPQGRRSVLLGLIYACTAAVFGGTTPFMITWLVYTTGETLAPALYMSAALIAGLVAMAFLPDTDEHHAPV